MKRIARLTGLLLVIALLGCNLPATTIGDPAAPPEPTAAPSLHTPTPDPPHPLPTIPQEPTSYTVQPNDTLGTISQQFGVPLATLIEYNNISNPDLLSVGQVLHIPPPEVGTPGPANKLIPDSELVYGPASIGFDIPAFIKNHNGHLKTYREEVEGRDLSGAEIVQMVAERYSVSPRLLLAVLEFQSGWLTQKQVRLDELAYPIGITDSWRAGLFQQLSWAADNLNRGFYLWRVNAAAAWLTSDGMLVPVDPTINAGTAGVQHLFALLYPNEEWRQVVAPDGFAATYAALFGSPFAHALEPSLPPNLSQPEMQLPFEPGVAWTFTGGPHGGWGNGAAWAALDFAPPMEVLGCNPNQQWVVAIAAGPVIRIDNGAVVQDLDGDGNEQTGWTILYMHVDSRERIPVGTVLQPGDRIGHPSCEGGFSTGTHLHIARRYDGEWIPADGPLPFVMDGWVSVGTGVLYDGIMQRGGQSVEACECQEPEHTLQRAK